MAVKSRKVPVARAKPAQKQGRKSGTKDTLFARKIARQATAIRDAEDKLTQTVRHAVARALREPVSSARPLFDTAIDKAREAMEATVSVGGDALVTVRSVTHGVLLGVSDAGGDSVSGAGKIASAVIGSAIASGGEAASAGWRSLQGVLDAASTIGTDTGSAVRTAANAIAQGAASARETASQLVERLVRTTAPRPQPAKTLSKAAKARRARGPVKAGRRKAD